MSLLQSIQSSQQAKQWVLFHMTLGVVATIFPIVVILWYYIFLIFTLIKVPSLNEKAGRLIIAEVLIYSGAFELIGRISRSSPYIPYELSKYLMMSLCFIGILLNVSAMKKSQYGLLILLFLIPSFFIDESGLVVWRDIRFNVFGVINVGLGILFFGGLVVEKRRLFSWLKLLAFPAITVLLFTIIKTPEIDELEFSLGASFETAGDFGSNQVSTVLGLGTFVMAVCLILQQNISGSKILDFMIMIAFTMQGLLTFSRGGMIGGALGVLIVLYYTLRLSFIERRKMGIQNPKKYILPIILSIILAFSIINTISGGMLSLRYQGETLGTTRGDEKTLNKITSGRSEIFLADIKLWNEYPFFGVGAGASKYIRSSHKGIVAHVELSRLLAEHGMFALIILMVLAALIINRMKMTQDVLSKGIVLAFFVVAIFTSFHAATRTFLTPLLLSIASVNIIKVNNKRI